MFISLLKILGGLLLLYGGAEALIRGSVSLAIRFHISRLVIGLTIIAFATSSPELVVGLKTAWAGQGDIAAGNMIGSNICNVALILGLAALIRPIRVQMQLVRFETPLMILASVVVTGLLLNGVLGRAEGLLLFALFAAYTAAGILLARKEKLAAAPAYTEQIKPTGSLALALFLIAAGIVLLAWGADLLVKGSVDVATRLGVSEAVIALTMVALGTSLPELAAAIVASLRDEGDIVMGNVIGSNLFNILCVLGLSALLNPLHLPGVRALDLAAMIATAVVLLPIMMTSRRILRLEGGLLLAVYAGYIVLLALR